MASTRSLDRSLVQGIAWTGGIKWLTQIISWAATLLVVRLLTPADYGLVGMAIIYMGLAQIVSEAGLATAVIQKRDLSDAQISSLNGLSVLLGVTLFAVTLATAEPLAWFFAEPDLRPVVLCFSLTFLTRSSAVVPRALMERDLQFRRLAWVDGAEAVSLVVVTLVLALSSAGHWALVLGSLASSVASTAVTLWMRRHPITIPRTLDGIANAAAFGWQVVAAQIAWYAYTNADFAVVGRVLGKAALGTYSFAWTIASIPVERVSGLVGRVTPAYFAAVQHDAAALRRYLVNVTEALALVTMPACIGLAIVADDFVQGVFGSSWSATATPLRLLAIYAAFRSIITPAPQILIATGHTRLSMYFSALAVVILPTAFYIGSHYWGTAGVALGWIVAYPAIAIGLFLRSAFRIIDLKARQYLQALTPAFTATLGMCAVLWFIRAQLPLDWSPVARLAAQVTAGAAVYAGIVLAIHGARLRAFRALLWNSPSLQEPPAPTFETVATPGRNRLLLISWHFAPDPAVGALRWAKLARYAAERGWGLDVIALDPHALQGVDYERLRDLPDGVRVYGVPPGQTHIEMVVNAVWSSLRLPARLLARWLGLKPSMTRGRVKSIARADLRWLPREPRDILRAYAAWLEYARYRRWAHEAARLAFEIVSPDTHRAVITCGPPHAAHLAGVEVSIQTRLPLIADLRDPWSLVQRLPEGTASPVWLALANRWERRVIERASLVVTNTQQLRNAMRGRYPTYSQRMIPVLNGYDDDPIPEPQRRDRFIVGYTGSIYLDRDPRLLFRAANVVINELELAPWEFAIELMGSVQAYDGVPLMQIAQQERIAEYVMLHRARPRHEAFEFLARASVLVALPQDSDMAIPAKVYDYMRFDSWILAIASRDSATAVLLRDTGADIVAPEDFNGLVDVLRRRYLCFQKGLRGRPVADARLSRRAQGEVLFTAIERLVGKPSVEKEHAVPERPEGWLEPPATRPEEVTGAVFPAST